MAENKPYIEREWQVHDASHFGKWFEDGPTVCAMNDDGSCHPIICFSGPVDRDEWEQVANLVAAAPKLYRACKVLIENGECTCSERADILNGQACEICAGLAAIAEVEGTTNG